MTFPSDRGLYHLHFATPFFSGLTEHNWNGQGYSLEHPYMDGAEITYQDQNWMYNRHDNTSVTIPPAREYRHTLSTVINGLVEHSFVIRHLSDTHDIHPDAHAETGTWDHFNAVAPPWLAVWAWYCPGSY